MSSIPAREAIAAMRKTIQERTPQFRILIIGPDNASKAKVTRRICGTHKDPTVWSCDGRLVKSSQILEHGWPRLHREQSPVENEIRYASNPGFIFHDSQGFEGGGMEELRNIAKFIEERAAKVQLHERLHAIWYCVPIGIRRVPHEIEEQFFRDGTKGVPIVLVFANDSPPTPSDSEQDSDDAEHRSDKPQAGVTQETLAKAFGPTDKKYLRQLLGSVKSKKRKTATSSNGDTFRHSQTATHRLTPTLADATASTITHSTLRYWFASLQRDKMALKYEVYLERIIPNVFCGNITLQERLPVIIREVLSMFLDSHVRNAASLL